MAATKIAPDLDAVLTHEGTQLRAGLGVEEVERRLCVAARMEEVGRRALAFYLADMDRRGLHQALGYSSTAQYGSLKLEIGTPRQVRDLIRVGRSLLELPGIDEAVRKGQLSWTKAEILTRVAEEATEDEWLRETNTRTCLQLREMVGLCKKGDRPKDASGKGLTKARFQVGGTMDLVQHELMETARKKLEAERGEPVTDVDFIVQCSKLILATRDDGTAKGRQPVKDSLFKLVVRQCGDCGESELLTEGGEVPVDLPQVEATLGEPERVMARERTRKTRGGATLHDGQPSSAADIRNQPVADLRGGGIDVETSAALRHWVFARDGFRCRVCGCRSSLHAHHLVFRSEGGPTEDWNLVTLCRRCHGLIHQRLLSVTGRAPDGLVIRDRKGDLMKRDGDVAGAVPRAVPGGLLGSLHGTRAPEVAGW